MWVNQLCFKELLDNIKFQEGFQLKVNFLKNCGVGEQVIKVFENSTGVLNDNCEVLSFACVETTGFMKADVKK